MGAASSFQPGLSHLHILNIWHLTNPTTRQKMFFLSNHNDYQDGLTYTFPTFDIWQIQHQNDICRSVQRGFSCNIRMKSSGDGKGWKGWWRTRDLMHELAGRKWECCCCCAVVVVVLWLLLWLLLNILQSSMAKMRRQRGWAHPQFSLTGQKVIQLFTLDDLSSL